MEFGYLDSFEYIDIDVNKLNFSEVVKADTSLEVDANEKPLKQKHVSFAPEPQIIKCTFNNEVFETEFKVTSVQPISILKKTDYKYSKFNEYIKKIDDILYLLLIVFMLAFFDRFLKKFF